MHNTHTYHIPGIYRFNYVQRQNCYSNVTCMYAQIVVCVQNSPIKI